MFGCHFARKREIFIAPAGRLLGVGGLRGGEIVGGGGVRAAGPREQALRAGEFTGRQGQHPIA